MDYVCICIRIFCGNHINPGKMRDQGDGFGCGDGNPYGGCVGFFMVHGPLIRFWQGDWRGGRENMGISGAVRDGHRGFVAVLF